MADIISTTFDQLNLDDPFFDSLKSMYRNFSTWFRNKAEEHASCDVVYDAEGNLKAMLYTKIEGKYEDYSRMEKPFAPSFRLKIGTLKSELRGEGIGKKFLEMAVELIVVVVGCTAGERCGGRGAAQEFVAYSSLTIFS